MELLGLWGDALWGSMDLSERSELSMFPHALRSPPEPRCSAPKTQGKAPGVLGVSLVMFPLLWYNRFQEKEVLNYVS